MFGFDAPSPLTSVVYTSSMMENGVNHTHSLATVGKFPSSHVNGISGETVSMESFDHAKNHMLQVCVGFISRLSKIQS